jgi:hypothetical protein
MCFMLSMSAYSVRVGVAQKVRFCVFMRQCCIYYAVQVYLVVSISPSLSADVSYMYFGVCQGLIH